jgi:hypothetical protein
MEPVPIKNGEIRVVPLAYESFGVRGMATYVETDDVKLVIDPGSALGPRFRLNPHEQEYVALSRTRQRILDAAKSADLLTISHYHYDHYVPDFEDWRFNWSSAELAERLYSGKLILAKDTSENINASQRKRGSAFRKSAQEHADEIRMADGQKLEYGSTTVEFSKPVYHGPEGTMLGFVLMLTVRTPGACLVHAPDVQGPMYGETLRELLSREPDALLIGGPPVYLSFRLDPGDIEAAHRNLTTLAERVPQLVVEHHLLRMADYSRFLKPTMEAGARAGNKVMTAAEFAGDEPRLLEAMRRDLHAEKPIEKEWYERLERGEFKEGF